tara:strand:+ start:102 stop:476 length:375 start_codon:yes stop_codon:yes gene_type:complete
MLTDTKRDALRLQLQGLNIPATAKTIGVGRATVWKWNQEPEYKSELNRLREDALDHAQHELRDSCVEAARVLREIMNDESVTPNARITAAKSILDRAKPVREDAEIALETDKEMSQWQTLKEVS